MIIDEGFLSNAKKIASTQPQNTEVRVPEIKRENWEHKVTFYFEPEYKEETTERTVKRFISSCIIFKEHGDISITYEKDKYEDEIIIITILSDLFITFDTLLELLTKSTYKIIPLYKDGEYGYFFEKIIITDSQGNETLKMNISKKTAEQLYRNVLEQNILINIYRKLNSYGFVSPKNFLRWTASGKAPMFTSDIYEKDTELTKCTAENIPVNIHEPELLTDMTDWYNPETDELTQYGQHTEHVTLQEIISEYDIHDFFTYKEMDTFNIIIQPAYPIIRRNLIAFPKYSVKIKTTDTHIDEQPVI